MTYASLSTSYDRLTRDVPYEEICRFLLSVCRYSGLTPRTCVDLACGTGSLSYLLAGEGLSVTGIDRSEEMLTAACSKNVDFSGERPLFVHGKMQSFRLPEKVDLIVCCLDSINYLPSREDVFKTFQRVYRGLKQGGMFLFDVNTPYKFRELDDQIFMDEDDDVYCVWRSEYSSDARVMHYGMDIFQRTGHLWRRAQEEHYEYAYEPSELSCWLSEAGFQNVRIYGDRSFDAPAEKEMRVYFSAVKE